MDLDKLRKSYLKSLQKNHPAPYSQEEKEFLLEELKVGKEKLEELLKSI